MQMRGSGADAQCAPPAKSDTPVARNSNTWARRPNLKITLKLLLDKGPLNLLYWGLIDLRTVYHITYSPVGTMQPRYRNDCGKVRGTLENSESAIYKGIGLNLAQRKRGCSE